MSTVVTSSLLFLNACSLDKSIDTNLIKVGVQSELLSFDPLSFQSLGENDVMALLYGRALYLEADALKTDFKAKVSLKKNKVIFNSLSKKEDEILRKIFKEGKKSTLWKAIFKDFKFKNNEILYLKKENFLFNLKSLIPLLKIRDKDYGAFKVKEHQKGVKVILERKSKDEDLNQKTQFIMIKKMKTMSAGLDQLSQRKIDVFLPLRAAKKNELKAYKDLEVVYSKDKEQKLRLYHKYKKNTALSSIFCKNQKEIAKVLESNWVLTHSDCDQEESLALKNLKVVLSGDFGQQILDLLANFYKKSKGGDLNYFSYEGLRLSEVLKSGEFNHYLSLDIESARVPYSYDSFHSKGRFNSLNIRNKTLDKFLEEASRAQSFRVFNKLRHEIKARLELVMPRAFEYTRPHIEFIKRKDQRLKVFKSSKRLMNFEKNPI